VGRKPLPSLAGFQTRAQSPLALACGTVDGVPRAFALLSGVASRGRSVALAALLISVLPAFAVKACGSAYADHLGTAIAAQLIDIAPSLPARGEAEVWGESAAIEPSAETRPSLRSAALGSKHPSQPARTRPAAKGGIRITIAQVMALVQRRAMPSAAFVEASAEHPSGLLLSGVSALGVGLQDGDILTEAAGQKATSVAQVVGIVLAARSRQAREISGRFYRGGVPFSLTVEQPYPKPPVPG